MELAATAGVEHVIPLTLLRLLLWQQNVPDPIPSLYISTNRVAGFTSSRIMHVSSSSHVCGTRRSRELRSQLLRGTQHLCFQHQVLTDICDVEGKPEEESVADQLCEEQTQGELDHTLREGEAA